MSQGYLSLILHAHLPFVRHPEHERFLEEGWFFEAVIESYVPLLRNLEGWRRSGLAVKLTLSLSPTLCAMLRDPLLRDRLKAYLLSVTELAEKEIHRTQWEPALNELALLYHGRLRKTMDFCEGWNWDLVRAFGSYQEAGLLEIITSAATHAVLPLLFRHRPSVRAQVFVARDEYRTCFGRQPNGIWLPECGYVNGLEQPLKEAGLRWFITDTHGLLHARPRPRFAVFAPVLTPAGVAAFGRDMESARQVWSRHEGYPGDPRYRDFYRDIGHDLDYEYLRPHLLAEGKRSFTGIKYHRVGGPGAVYERRAALEAAEGHATHFLEARTAQTRRLAVALHNPPLLIAPYDAELFGHWWYEGPEFLDLVLRKAALEPDAIECISPEDYLGRHPHLQVATPAASSWGEGGYWRMWLNEQTEWIYRHLHPAQERMTQLTQQFAEPTALEIRALKQAGRELLLAQASDWPFILRTGTSPQYARRRVDTHLLRFTKLYEQLKSTRVQQEFLAEIELLDNLFPNLDYRYWAPA